MNECVAVNQSTHIYQYKFSGALRTFFYKLCKYLREAPAIFIFVFDGPDRPSFKHGRDINTQTAPEWAGPCKQIIEAFGFYWHQVSSYIDYSL